MSVLNSHLTSNIGVIDFIKVLYANNKPLLFSEREMTYIL